jgi:competence protein ComEC
MEKVPLLRVLVPFIAGILAAGQEIRRPDAIPYLFVAGMSACLILVICFRRIPLPQGVAVGITALLFLLSFFCGFYHSSTLNNRSAIERISGEAVIRGIVTSAPAESANSYRLLVRIDGLYPGEHNPRSGQFIMVYVRKDSTFRPPAIGEHWMIMGRLQPIRNRGNPGEFDYAGYMGRRDTWFFLFTDSHRMRRINSDKPVSIRYLPARVAEQISRSWDFSTPAFCLLRAITLGQREGLDRDTRESFAQAGAMHLLAVSGLHVGMVWWILQSIIPLPRRFRAARMLKALLVLSILWFYAGITGFSDSVTRSVTMFSIMTVSTNLKRPSNTYNSLFVSALILLAADPGRLYDPGFQLSYAAVLGIVSVHPLIKQALPAPGPALSRIVDLMIVSVSAQLATLPFSLHYFHAFPTWFLLTNLVAIPLVSLLLALFVVSTPFLLLDLFAEPISRILEFIALALHWSVDRIASLPGSTIQTSFCTPKIEACLTGAIIFMMILFFYYRRAICLILLTFFISSLLILTSYGTVSMRQSAEFIVYNFHEETVISFRKGRRKHVVRYPMPAEEHAYITEYIQTMGMERYTNGFRCTSLAFATGVPGREPSQVLSPGRELWIIPFCRFSILLCGACEPDVLACVLDNVRVSHVIFRKGFPLLHPTALASDSCRVFIADGTVSAWRETSLEKRIPGVFLVSQSGAYRQKVEKDFN